MPNLLPGGRPVSDPAARVDIAAAWDVAGLPTATGRDTSAMLTAAKGGQLAGLVVAGVDPGDLPDPTSAVQALEAVGFLVSLEVRASAVTQLADVVLPVAPVTEKGGTFVTWEGRWRAFEPALISQALPDFRVIGMLADAMDVPIGLRGLEQVRGELAELEAWEGLRAPGPVSNRTDPPRPGVGSAALATWAMLLDSGRLQDGEAYLAGTARVPIARLSAATAAEIGLAAGDLLTVSTPRGAITVPVQITAMPDRVVWLPTNSVGCAVRATLGAEAGSVVSIAPATPSSQPPTGTDEPA